MFAVPETLAPAVLPPLQEVTCNSAFVRAVLDGSMPGRIWADHLQSPQLAHVLHPYGMSLIWGRAVDRGLDRLLPHLHAGTYRTRDEWLQIDPRWQHLDWDGLLGVREGAAERYHRSNFRFDQAAFDARPADPPLPQGWSLQPMTAAAFNLPDVSVTPAAFWPSAERFLAHGGGICAMKNGEVGAMAFASMRWDNYLEIGIETREPYRGQGLAHAVAVAMVRFCLDNGIEPVWACRKENTGSFRIARSLGFSVCYEGPFYRLPVPDTAVAA